jgi:hypothetical protein
MGTPTKFSHITRLGNDGLVELPLGLSIKCTHMAGLGNGLLLSPLLLPSSCNCKTQNLVVYKTLARVFGAAANILMYIHGLTGHIHCVSAGVLGHCLSKVKGPDLIISD